MPRIARKPACPIFSTLQRVCGRVTSGVEGPNESFKRIPYDYTIPGGKRVIEKLKPRKAVGAENISFNLLRHIQIDVLHVLHQVFNCT